MNPNSATQNRLHGTENGVSTPNPPTRRDQTKPSAMFHGTPERKMALRHSKVELRPDVLRASSFIRHWFWAIGHFPPRMPRTFPALATMSDWNYAIDSDIATLTFMGCTYDDRRCQTEIDMG